MKKFVFPFLLAGTALMMITMAKTGSSLKTPETPYGIINLELASSGFETNEIVNTWKQVPVPDIVANAKINTWLDFIFIFFYSLLLFYCCKVIAVNSSGFINNVGNRIAGSALIAGFFDILENTGMFMSLNGHISNVNTIFTAVFSYSKWLLVALAVAYILIAGSLFLIKKIGKR